VLEELVVHDGRMLFPFRDVRTYTTTGGYLAMSSTQPQTVVKFEIKSLDPSLATIESVPAAETLASDLQAIVAARYPGTTVEIRRAEGIPGLREIQELLLYVDWHAVKTGAETAVGSFAAMEFLKLMKDRLRNIFVKPVPGQSSSANTSATPSVGKTRKGKPAQSKKKTHKASKRPQSKKKSRPARNKRAGSKRRR
jgi:hypothetical protein